MTDFINFLQNHVLLSSVFVLLLFAVIVLEATIIKSNQDISAAKAVDLINHSNALVLDIRANEDYSAGHIVNSINISLMAIINYKVFQVRSDYLSYMGKKYNKNKW